MPLTLTPFMKHLAFEIPIPEGVDLFFFFLKKNLKTDLISLYFLIFQILDLQIVNDFVALHFFK